MIFYDIFISSQIILIKAEYSKVLIMIIDKIKTQIYPLLRLIFDDNDRFC